MPAARRVGIYRKGASSPAKAWPRRPVANLLRKRGSSRPRRCCALLGVKAYLRDKDLALFAWVLPALPDPKTLICSAFFELKGGALLPEFDRFGLFTIDEAMTRVGKNLARLLAEISLSALTC